MPKITILAVGRCKEKFQKEAIKEYQKRLSKYCESEILEVEDLKIKEKISEKEKEKILEIEGERILKKIPDGSYLFVLDVHGKEMDSIAFEKKISEIFLLGKSHLTFVIGGSLGISKEVVQKADFRLSLSPMTFTHLMSREILLEQLYRAMKIRNGEVYHK